MNPNTNSYYNTNKESGEVLKESNRKAQSQEDIILKFIKHWYPVDCFSCEDIADHIMHEVPLTSFRRAVSNLTKKGYLEKTDKMKEGFYGKMVHQWKLKKFN